jgi:hypothetical protein
MLDLPKIQHVHVTYLARVDSFEHHEYFPGIDPREALSFVDGEVLTLVLDTWSTTADIPDHPKLLHVCPSVCEQFVKSSRTRAL